MRGRGRDDVRLLVSDGPERVAHTTFADLPRHLSSRRPRRREHLGDRARRGRGDDTRRHRDPRSTSRPSCRAGCGSSRPGNPSATRRRHSMTTSPGDIELAGGGHLALLERFAGSRRLWLAAPHLARHGARPPVPVRRADPLPARARSVAARRVPADLRRRARQRGDAERVAAVHARDRRRPRATRRRDRADPAAHRSVVARRRRDAVPRALRSAGVDREPRERGARRWRTGRRHRHDRSAGPRDRHRRPRRRASRTWMDRARRHSGARRACGRRSAHRMARTGGDAPPHARGDRRAAYARTGLRRGTTRGIPVARVRRQPPAAA